MSPCPFCETQMESVPDTETECPKCHTKWQTSIALPGPHAQGDIDPFFKDRHKGLQQTVLHPPGTVACPQCGQVYPGTSSCCPELVKVALGLLCMPKNKQGPSTEAKALRFLTEHKVVLEHYVKQVHKTGTPEEMRLVEDSNIGWILGLKA